jgi:tetratricopeptide (TPR) repeat protein
MAMGSLAGPVTRDYLERQVPASPERDLMLAFAYQQSGQLDQAEHFYRSLPEFAESWNNLGVILRAKGNEPEAKQAFEKALQLHPGLGEATVNLGQTPRGLWAEQFAQYFPGRPMLAPPEPQRVSVALFGSSFQRICLRGLAGPLADWNSFGTVFFVSGTGSEDAPAADIFTALVLAVFVLAFVLLFIPSRPVTEAPPRAFLIAEVLFPGLAKAWRFLGGWVFVAWVYLLFQTFLMIKVGTPYILTSIAEPGLTRTYNVPAGDAAALSHYLSPGRTWTYLAPLALFLLNLGLVAFSRRKTHQADSSARR